MNTPAKRTFAVSIQRGGFFKVHIHSFSFLVPASSNPHEH